MALALVALAAASTASAVTIHQHRQVPQVVGGIDAGSPIITKREIVRVKDVAPADSDDDGCANARDSYDGPGCNAPPPVTTSYAGGVAPATTYASGALPSCTYIPESGGDPNIVSVYSGGGYYGIIQSTWDNPAYGGPATGYAAPYDAPLSVQTQVAQAIWADAGPSAWANC